MNKWNRVPTAKDPKTGYPDELSGMLDMHEMECAVAIMLQKAERLNIPFWDLGMNASEFDIELTGFCQLLARGWLIPAYPNMYFRVGPGLVKIMREHRECWKDMPDPSTFIDWYKARRRYITGGGRSMIVGRCERCGGSVTMGAAHMPEWHCDCTRDTPGNNTEWFKDGDPRMTMEGLSTERKIK